MVCRVPLLQSDDSGNRIKMLCRRFYLKRAIMFFLMASVGTSIFVNMRRNKKTDLVTNQETFSGIGLDKGITKVPQNKTTEDELGRRRKDLDQTKEKEFMTRRKLLLDGCARVGEQVTVLPSRDVIKRLIVNERHRLLYCKTGKVWSTQWIRLFVEMAGNEHAKNLNGREVHESLSQIKTLDQFSDEEIKVILESYTKFMFTRHPFERLLSAYIDKFLGPDDTYRQHIGGKIVRRYRLNETKLDQSGNFVRFEEFVRFVTDPHFEHTTKMDTHWGRFIDLCEPCVIKYDYIGKFDTMVADAEHILTKAEVDPSIMINEDKRNKLIKSSTYTNMYFSSLPEVLHKAILRKYKEDFVLFGYSPIKHR